MRLLLVSENTEIEGDRSGVIGRIFPASKEKLILRESRLEKSSEWFLFIL
jgi:hypothetical protein